MKKTAVVWTAIIAVVTAGACSEVSFEGGGPVAITLISDRTTATVGQNIAFDVEARGSILDGVIITYGDGLADTMYTAGAMSAHRRFLYAYDSAGTFAAVGTAYDAIRGQASDTVVVQITGG
ncbi:MAG TPA: hypothetical protein VLH75_17430 [Longimicrobiales bacterium]|nr:hypothetical protein [Longimicrobiales bacterium]